MALMPKRVKFRKFHRGNTKGKATRGNVVAFGEYALQTLEPGRISAQQIEAGRVAAGHFLQDEGKLFIRIFPHMSVTGRPAETRMGKGKGEPAFWAAYVKPGTVLYELSGVPEEHAREAFVRIAHRMPVRTRMIGRRTKV